MAKISCDDCGKEVIRTVFCCDKCRIRYFRKIHKTVIITKENIKEVTGSFQIKEHRPVHFCNKHEEPLKVWPLEAPLPLLLKVTTLGTCNTLPESCWTVPVAQLKVLVFNKVIGAYLIPEESAPNNCPCWVGTVEVPVPPLLTGTTLL